MYLYFLLRSQILLESIIIIVFLFSLLEYNKVSYSTVSKEKSFLFIKKDGKPFARVSFFGEDEKWTKDYALKEKESK